MSEPSLRSAAVARRVDALFKAMSTDFLLREQFVTEPTQILSEYVHGQKIPPEQAAASDHLLYAVMSNSRLLAWIRDYATKQRGVRPSHEQFVHDFSRAVVTLGGHHVVLALARSSASKVDVLNADNGLLTVIFELFARDLARLEPQTEMSTGHTTGTDMSTGHTVARGPGIDQGLRAQTEMSTGHTTGTDMSTGHAVARGPGIDQRLRAQTEMSTGHTTGTDMSTGHAVARGPGIDQRLRAQTEMSTGHTTGTDMSTGHAVARAGDDLGASFRAATFGALVEHATHLRDIGALDVVFGI